MTQEELVLKAKEGDSGALEKLLDSIRDRLYNLSLRMLWHPEDAEDATQEILIRIFTHLGTFRGECSFSTWTYRVASNYLLTTRKRRMENLQLTFDSFSEDLERGFRAALPVTLPDAEKNVMEEEVKIGCTHAMLLCLDRDHRLAYILGEIIEMSGPEAAQVLEISPLAFRKRLSRARKSIQEFMNRNCGLINSSCPCRCSKRIAYAREQGRLDPEHLLFAGRPISNHSIRNEVSRLHQLRNAAALLRNHPDYSAPESLRARIRSLLNLKADRRN